MKNKFLSSQTGTPFYASPEIWKHQAYDFKTDIWSLGCVLYEMITLKTPFKGEDWYELYSSVTQGKYPRIPSHYSHKLNETLKMLIQVNPQARCSCGIIFTHY